VRKEQRLNQLPCSIIIIGMIYLKKTVSIHPEFGGLVDFKINERTTTSLDLLKFAF
jgi:hypothetical protein